MSTVIKYDCFLMQERNYENRQTVNYLPALVFVFFFLCSEFSAEIEFLRIILPSDKIKDQMMLFFEINNELEKHRIDFCKCGEMTSCIYFRG